jgi:hypothetical protein
VVAVTELNGTVTSLSLTPCELLLMISNLRVLRPLETHITLNGRNINFVNRVKSLGVIFETAHRRDRSQGL